MSETSNDGKGSNRLRANDYALSGLFQGENLTPYSSAIFNSFFGIGFFPSVSLFLAERTVTSIKSQPLSFGNRFTLFRRFFDALFFAIPIHTVRQ
jgi:hypothetical protein